MPEFVTAPYMKFSRGTPIAYHKLSRKDPDTLYFVAEADAKTGQLWIGEKLIQTTIDEQGVIKFLNELEDVNTSGAKQGSILIYDEAKGTWIASDNAAAVAEMVGASAEEDGQAGLVPKPKAGDQRNFLRGDGTWASIDPYTSNIQVFDILCEKGQSHADAIAAATADTILDNGDIAIVRDLVDEENEKYIYTMYLYFNEHWLRTNSVEFSSNAENILFKKDLQTTYNLGNFTTENGKATIPAAGKSIEEVFEEIFVQEREPEIIQPSVEIVLNESGDYEAGTEITLSYKVNFDGGSYEYGPETDVEVTKQTVNPKVMEKMTVDESTNFGVAVDVDYNTGATPVTNLGNPREELKIEEGTVSAESKKITGYRAIFYGAVSADSVINSKLIRGLTNGGNYNETKTLIITAQDIEKPIKFVVAVPHNRIRSGLSKVELVSYGDVDITSEYAQQDQVDVEGLNGYKSVLYDVFVYQPAVIDKNEVHRIILA